LCRIHSCTKDAKKRKRVSAFAAEGTWIFLIDCADFLMTNGSSQGHNLAVTVLCVPNSLDSACLKDADGQNGNRQMCKKIASLGTSEETA
jgi:hypothetical protein